MDQSILKGTPSYSDAPNQSNLLGQFLNGVGELSLTDARTANKEARTGQAGKCLNVLNTTTGVASISHASNGHLSFEYNQPFTICLWVNITLNNQMLWSKFDGTKGILFNIGGGGLNFTLKNTSSNNLTVQSSLYRPATATSNQSATVSASGWRHIAVTYNGSGLASGVTLYLDETPLIPTVTSDTLAGATIVNTTNWSTVSVGLNVFSGSMYDCRFYNVAKSQAEIINIRRFKEDITGICTKLTFEEGSGTTFYNSCKTSALISTYGQGVGNATYTNSTFTFGANTLYSYLNNKGYTLSGSVYIPRNVCNTGNIDAIGGTLTNPLPSLNRISLIQSFCANIHVNTITMSFASSLPAGATMTYSGTVTATLDVAGSQITFSNTGTFYNVSIKNNLGKEIYQFTCSEGAGSILYDRYSLNNLTITGATELTFWNSTQDVYHANFTKGYTKYTHATANPIYLTYGINNAPRLITTPSGYTRGSDYINGNHHNKCETKINFNPDNVPLSFLYNMDFPYVVNPTVPTAYSVGSDVNFTWDERNDPLYCDRSNSLKETNFLIYRYSQDYTTRGPITAFVNISFVIYGLHGQSNGAGLGAVGEIIAPYTGSLSNSYGYNYGTGLFQSYAGGLFGGSSYGPEISALYRLQLYTNQRVYMIKDCVYSTSIRDNGNDNYWSNNWTGSSFPVGRALYPWAFDRLIPAIKNFTNSGRKIKCYIINWDQGEQDNATTSNVLYESNVKSLCKAFMTDIRNKSGITCPIWWIQRRLSDTQQASTNATTKVAMRSALVNIADPTNSSYVEHFNWYDSDGSPVQADGLHFTGGGEQINGHNLYLKIISLGII